MATHSSILAWRIPGMEEPGGLPSLGLHRVGHDCSDLAAAAATIFIFWMLIFKPNFSLSSFTFIKRLLSSSLLSAIRVVSPVYLRLLIFLLAILIPTCASSNPAFCLTYFAYKLHMQVTIYRFEVLLNPTLKDFEYYLAGMWNKCNCMVIWTSFGIAFL